MCVCVCVCVCTCTYMYLDACLHVCLSMCMYVCVCIHCTHVHVCAYVCMHVQLLIGIPIDLVFVKSFDHTVSPPVSYMHFTFFLSSCMSGLLLGIVGSCTTSCLVGGLVHWILALSTSS